MKIAYARVSTDAQETHLQMDALKRAKCGRVYQEKASGAKAERPELMKLLDNARKGDVVIVWKLDRLARSLRQLIDTTAVLRDQDRAVNELASGMVRVLDARGRLPPVIHQTGTDQFGEMQVNYAALGYEGRVDVRAYIDDMPAVLAQAAVCVARAGALTLAELAIMRRPAILIPLPTAADDHQTMNARAFERAGAAFVLPQAEASATRLGDLVDEILQDPGRRAKMAAAMGALARPGATHDIVAELGAIAR